MVVFLLVALIAVGVALVVYGRGRMKVWREWVMRRGEERCEHPYDTTLHADCIIQRCDSMEYNVLYPHSDPSHGALKTTLLAPSLPQLVDSLPLKCESSQPLPPITILDWQTNSPKGGCKVHLNQRRLIIAESANFFFFFREA